MKKFIPFVVAFALFLETLDATIISTAIPAIARDFGVNPISLKLALTSYLLSLAIFIPLSGWVADKFGSKKVFIIALSIFTFGSFLCGISFSLGTLILARILQGIGGALMMPVGRLILLRTFSKSELIKVTNYVTLPSLLGPALGPTIGGAIVSCLSWRWIFMVNLPFGILGILFASKVLTQEKIRGNYPMDFVGFFLFSMGIAIFSFSFEMLGEGFFSMETVSMMVTLALILMTTYIFYSRSIQFPFVDLSLFSIRTFKLTVVGSLLSRLGIGGIPFLLPLMFQLSLAKNALYSGMLLVPYAVGMICAKFIVKKWLRKIGFKNLLISNTFLLGLSIYTFSQIYFSTHVFVVVLLVFINGWLTSLQFSAMNVLSYVDLSSENMSRGTSFASAIQQLSMSFGIGIAALLLRFGVGEHLNFHTAVSHFPIEIFHDAFVFLGGIMVLPLSVFCFLDKLDGQEASGYIIRRIDHAKS